MKLYEISENLQAVERAAVEAGPDDQELFAAALKELRGDLVEKLDGCGRVVRRLELEAAGLKDEEKRLAARRKALEANGTRLKDYIRAAMEQASTDKVRTPLFSMAIQRSAPRVVIDNEDAIPDTYKITTTAVVKAELLAALKQAEVAGAHLERGTHLRIR